MPKCASCRTNQREWLWQPFGPGEVGTFALPGSQYRGFPAIGICDTCRDSLDRGEDLAFHYKGEVYIGNTSTETVIVSPF